MTFILASDDAEQADRRPRGRDRVAGLGAGASSPLLGDFALDRDGSLAR